MGAAAGTVWQPRQAWFSEVSGFCGRLGWWQTVQAMSRLPAWLSWSKVTAPSFAGSVILPWGRCAARAGVVGSSICVVGGGADVAAGDGVASGCVVWVVTSAFGAAVEAGRGGVVVGAAGAEAVIGASVAIAPGMGDAG